MRSDQERLRESERRLNAVLSNATVAILLMDDRQRCVYMNRAAEILTGFTLGEILALDRPLHDIIHHTRPDGSHFPLEECAIDRAFPVNHQEQGEEVFVHKDGSFYPVAFTASPIHDEAAQVVGTIIEVRDIREEKLAQERQRLLINELNHRVKNTLATVQSIAAQTFRGAEREKELAVFNGRLLALSNAHNILTDENWESASLRAVVETAIQPFAVEGSARFVLDGPDHRVSPKLAVTLSMVLHELATNAMKHGSLTSPSGQVSIRWMIAGHPEPRLQLSWRESGGPTVVPPSRRGFGTRLIERQFAMEFDAQVKLDFARSGLMFTVDVLLTSFSLEGAKLFKSGAPAPDRVDGLPD